MRQNQEITYQQKGEYFFPNLTMQKEEAVTGKYAILRRQFLKEHRRNWYQSMMLTGKLTPHLNEIEQSAQERLEAIVAEMAQKEGVTEQLKADDPMAWIQRMNSLRNRAEEIVLTELVYS